jgi:YD repeat-containing protein
VTTTTYDKNNNKEQVIQAVTSPTVGTTYTTYDGQGNVVGIEVVSPSSS